MIPESVDCIVLGTGLTNSILAAACSRIGKTVLHVDKNNYYGRDWASFTFQQLIDWIKSEHPNDDCLRELPKELLEKSRMFCIDLCPRMLYSTGPMVDLLVKSNVSRYHEFLLNIRILSIIGDEIHVMPCRRSEVFTSSLLSDLVDKRKLMKFIELCIKYDSDNLECAETKEINSNASKTISDFLNERGLKETLKQYIINSIAMVDPNDSTLGACEKIKRFLIATERYGRTPFIFPIYGCGEFPQSFCRLSAVFGGVYCLNTQVTNVKVNTVSEDGSTNTSDRFSIEFSHMDNQHKVRSDILIAEYKDAIKLSLGATQTITDELSRAIIITRKSIVPNSDKINSFLRIPPSDTISKPIYLLELNASAMVCPPDINIIYLWTDASSEASAEHELGPSVARILGGDDNVILWKYFYKQLKGSEARLIDSTSVDGFHITSPPCNDIDYSHSVKEAEQIFAKMYPDEEFLPRAPDPEEIIHS